MQHMFLKTLKKQQLGNGDNGQSHFQVVSNSAPPSRESLWDG